MNNKSKTIWSGIFAAFIGILVLLSGYSDNASILQFRQFVLSWAGLLFGVLIFLAIINFIFGKIRNLGDRSQSFLNNFITFAVFIAVLIYGISKPFEDADFQEAVFNVQSAVESALAGLICVAMISGLYRLAKFRRGKMKAAFVLSFIIFLLIYSGLFLFLPENSVLTSILHLVETLPLGGVYGLLIGIAFGALVTGIRLLFLGEHPYHEREK